MAISVYKATKDYLELKATTEARYGFTIQELYEVYLYWKGQGYKLNDLSYGQDLKKLSELKSIMRGKK